MLLMAQIDLGLRQVRARVRQSGGKRGLLGRLQGASACPLLPVGHTALVHRLTLSSRFGLASPGPRGMRW